MKKTWKYLEKFFFRIVATFGSEKWTTSTILIKLEEKTYKADSACELFRGFGTSLGYLNFVKKTHVRYKIMNKSVKN